jgi:hypothetical protein
MTLRPWYTIGASQIRTPWGGSQSAKSILTRSMGALFHEER